MISTRKSNVTIHSQCQLVKNLKTRTSTGKETYNLHVATALEYFSLVYGGEIIFARGK